jgi:hypothetical protein
MNIPGAYPGEYPILAVWTEGGHIHSCWSAWTVHCSGSQDTYLLRHTEGFEPPFKTRECELAAATYAGIIERLEMVSVPLIAHSKVMVCDGSYVGMAYRGGSQPVSLRWYGVPPRAGKDSHAGTVKQQAFSDGCCRKNFCD